MLNVRYRIRHSGSLIRAELINYEEYSSRYITYYRYVLRSDAVGKYKILKLVCQQLIGQKR